MGWGGAVKRATSQTPETPRSVRVCPSCGAELRLMTHWSAWLVIAILAGLMSVIIVLRVRLGHMQFHSQFPLLGEFVYACPLISVLSIRALSRYVPVRVP